MNKVFNAFGAISAIIVCNTSGLLPEIHFYIRFSATAAITFSKIHSQTLNLTAHRGSLLVSFSAIAVALIASLGLGAKPIVVSEVQGEVSSFIEGGQNQGNFRLVTVTALGLIAKYVRLGVKNKTFDQYTKACLKDCFDLYSDSLSALDDAVVAFKSKDLDTASINLSATLDNSVTCEDQFKDKKGETSSPLTKENNVYFQLNESIGNAVFFSVYEYVHYYMHSNIKAASSNYTNLVDIGIGIVSGGLGGVVFWLTVLPLGVAKTLIQTNPDKNCSRNPFRILSSIYQKAGFKGCYTVYLIADNTTKFRIAFSIAFEAESLVKELGIKGLYFSCPLGLYMLFFLLFFGKKYRTFLSLAWKYIEFFFISRVTIYILSVHSVISFILAFILDRAAHHHRFPFETGCNDSCRQFALILEPQSIQRSGQSQFESKSYIKSWIQSSKRDVYLGANLNGPDNYLKGIINSALKGLDDTPQPKSKAAARWIVVKCNRQKGITECGYYVMHWMSSIILGSFGNNWETYFNEVRPLEAERFKALRIQWAQCYLKVRNLT
ncbi:Mitochondrial arginine transporter BAC1 [Glycine soja]